MTTKPTIYCFVGTRPEYIKTYPVIKALKACSEVDAFLVETGQHSKYVTDVTYLRFPPLVQNLSQSTPSTQLADLSVALLSAATKFLSEQRPDLVIVQGDTISATQVALAAWYLAIPVAHIEAGLRTYDVTQPYPEELGRRTIDHLATLNFAPTPLAMDNLLREQTQGRAYLTGNTVVDALNMMQVADPTIMHSWLEAQNRHVGVDSAKQYVLITAHRRENQDHVIPELAKAIKQCAQDNLHYNFIIIKHANPLANQSFDVIASEADGSDNIILLAPQTYPNFLSLLSAASFVVSDSGGIQEEAPYFEVPVLVLRELTERLEGLELGLSKLAGKDARSITKNINELIQDPMALTQMRAAIRMNPCLYGDGNSAQRIVKHCLDFISRAKQLHKQQSPLGAQ